MDHPPWLPKVITPCSTEHEDIKAWWAKTNNFPIISNYCNYPSKNMTENLIKIPRYFIIRMDGSLSSISTPNSMKIPCHLSRLYLFSMLKHYTGFGQVQVMEFPWHLLRKRWDFRGIWINLVKSHGMVMKLGGLIMYDSCKEGGKINNFLKISF